MSVYVGSSGRSSRYAGAKATDSMYLGADRLFPLWTPTFLSVTPYLIVDPATFTWSGSNFSSGVTANPGSIGGNLVTSFGTPTKAAGDNNGYDAVQMSANTGFGIASAVKPAGNMFCLYISKRMGAPNGAVGAIISQAAQTPGWVLYDQVTTTINLSNGHTALSGDVGWIGWPSGTTNVDKDVIVHPTADDGAYHIHCALIGTSHLWNYDGTDLTPTYYTDHSVPSVTGDLLIGTSYGGQNYNGRLGYLLLSPPPATDEITKMQGWAAWKYNRVSLLPSGHTYKSMAPTASAIEVERAADRGLYLPRRKLIVPDKGWRLAA